MASRNKLYFIFLAIVAQPVLFGDVRAQEILPNASEEEPVTGPEQHSRDATQRSVSRSRQWHLFCASLKHEDEHFKMSCDGIKERCFMRKFYSLAAIVALSLYLLSGVGSPAPQRNYQLQQNLEQLQQNQQIDQLRREQEQNQLQEQLNTIPHQPAEGVERRQQLNDQQQRLDELQLERQQNQLRQEQELNQLQQERQLDQSERGQQLDQFQREQQLEQLQQQQQIDQLREQQQKIR